LSHSFDKLFTSLSKGEMEMMEVAAYAYDALGLGFTVLCTITVCAQ
jgi:hypothetical protein